MPAENRARVLRAASRSFLRHGYHTSVEEIARRAGVAKQTLYHHFPSKDELFKEVACDLAKHVLVGLAAELFLSMLAGHERVRRLYGIANGAEAEARRTGRIVDCFLRAFGSRGRS